MSISKNELRQVRSLAQKKFRDEAGLFVVEGEKMVSEALASGFEVVSVYRRDEIGEEAMARLSMLSSPSPVLAVVRQPAPTAFQPSRGLFLAFKSPNISDGMAAGGGGGGGSLSAKLKTEDAPKE